METSLSLIEHKLRLSNIPQDSVSDLWENNFYDSNISLPPSHEVYKHSAWQDFTSFLLASQEESLGIWNVLMRVGVHQDSVTAAVFIALSEGRETILRLWACLGYVCILCVEGANVYKLFHPVVFQRCVECVCSVTKGNGGKEDVPAARQDECSDMDVDSEGSGALESGDEMELIGKILTEMKKLLKSFRFQLHPDSLVHLITALFSLIKNSAEPSHSLCSLAWRCVEEVHRPLHGDEKAVLSEVIKHLFPLLTFQTREGKNQSSIPKHLQQLSEHALSYLQTLLDSGLMEREAKITFIVIPRHLCMKCPPLTQYKSKCSRIVRELVSRLPEEEFSAFFRWFSSLLSSRRHEHRNMSVSVALEFILSTHEDCQVSLGSESESEERSNLCDFLLDCVVRRCSDSVCPVRSNALQALSELSSSSLPNIQESVRGLLSASGCPLLSMLARRLTDEKAGVRKSGLVALESLLRLMPAEAIADWTQLIRQRAFDSSLTVRKQVVSSLRELLLLSPTSRPLQHLFLSGLLPLVTDPESAVQERSAEVLYEEIFSGLGPHRANSAPPLAWELLTYLCREESFPQQRYFLFLLQRLGKAGKLSRQLMLNLFSYADGAHHETCWRLLALLSQQTGAIDVDRVYAAWRKSLDAPACSQEETFSMVKVLSNLHLGLSDFQADRLKSWLAESVEKFSLDPDKISLSVNALILLCQHPKNPVSERPGWFSSWAARMICSCNLHIKDCLQSTETRATESDCSEQQLIPYLSLLGELITVSPDNIDPDIPPLVQWALIQKRRQNPDCSFSDNIHLSERTRAFVCILFGKLCLVKQELAYDSPDLLAEELFTSSSVPIKNNIIIVLCDLCIRYPNLIENYLSHVSPCLRDASYVVRRQTLTLLTQLIQEDYIKLRGALIYHLLAVINDSELGDLVKYCLKHVLLKKYPRAFYHHFIECIFYFQDNRNHPSLNQFSKSQMEVARFALPGAHNTKKRFCIYNYMLEQLSDEQRFNLSARIVQDILGSIVDRILKLEDSNDLVITDALSVLCSDEIKLSCVKTHSVENLEDDEREAMEAAVTLQSDMIKTLVKKDVIDNIIPTIISVKRLLQKQRSPLLSHLMRYLYRLKVDYKEKFSEVLAADKQLAEEIEFDIKRYEEDLAQVRRNANVRASLSAAEAALSNPNFSPLLLLSPLSNTVTKTLREVRRPSRMENSPSVLQLTRLTSIRGETRRRIMSPLTIACNTPLVNETDGSPDLQTAKKRNKSVNRTRGGCIRPTEQQEKEIGFRRPKNKPSNEHELTLATPPTMEQDVLLNSFASSPPVCLDTSSRANIQRISVRGSVKNVISFSPAHELSDNSPTWNLSLREKH